MNGTLGGFPLGATEILPINVRSQVFAAHRAVSHALDGWATVSRNISIGPFMYGLNGYSIARIGDGFCPCYLYGL